MFPKDVKALIAFAEEKGYDFKLLKDVDGINEEMGEHFVNKIINHFHGDISKKPLQYSGSRLSRIPMTCAKLRLY